jgi:hypothetical protein
MRPLIDMDTIQIEITNACGHKCSNCTRFVGHHTSPYFMSVADFRCAVDSMENYPKMTGVMGGEPLLHPDFEEMCKYAATRIPPSRLGLWSCFPPGYEDYREVIVATFGHIFLNDQSRNDILHSPLLVTPAEVKEIPEWMRWYCIDKCWVQNAWSAAINPRGAYFCEIAAAISVLLDKGRGWDVTPDWWQRTPKDYVKQMERYCVLCGAAMPLRKRVSTELVDDVSPEWLKMLRRIRSPKERAGKYVIHTGEVCVDDRQTATYKDPKYRDAIAARYGMFLMPNEMGFQTPYLKRKWKCGEESRTEDRKE